MQTVTVVIPTHDRAFLIAQTIQCVLNQTWNDFEVIVVDNGSRDNTRAVVTGINDSRIRYIYQDDTGSPAGPRNTGILQAEGRYVALLDDDDIWYPHKLARVMEVFGRDPSLDVVCHYEYERRRGEIGRMFRHGPGESDMYARLLLRGNCLSGSATTVKTQVLREAGGFREGPEYFEIEDYDLWLRLARMGKRFGFLEEPLGEFVVHKTSGTFAGLDRRFPNLRRMLREHFRNYGPASFADVVRFELLMARTFLSQVKVYAGLLGRRDLDLAKQLEGKTQRGPA